MELQLLQTMQLKLQTNVGQNLYLKITNNIGC